MPQKAPNRIINNNGVKQWNLNSILTSVGIACVVFVWNSVLKTNENVVRIQSSQDAMGQTLKELMPKSEIMLRFGVIEKDMADVRTRLNAVEIEVAKLKK